MDGIAGQAAFGKPAVSGAAFGLSSREFNGSTDHVNLGNLTGIYSTEVSAAAWVKLDTIPVSTAFVSVVSGAFSTSVPFGLFRDITGGANKFGCGFFNGAWRTVQGSTTLATGVWYHIAGTYDGSTMTFYHNGSSEGAPLSYAATPPMNAGDHKIGIKYDSVDGIDGKIADVRYYNRALSASEVADLAAGVDVSSGLVGWWLLNSDDVLDYSGSGNNGTNNGSAFSTDGPLD